MLSNAQVVLLINLYVVVPEQWKYTISICDTLYAINQSLNYKCV